jgi:hypothetical protein
MWSSLVCTMMLSVTLEAQLMQFSLLYSMWSSLAHSLALWCWRGINSRNTAWNKDMCVCVCVRERERRKVWNLLRADCAKRKSIDIQKINSQSEEEGVRFVCVFSKCFFFLPMQGTPTIIVQGIHFCTPFCDQIVEECCVSILCCNMGYLKKRGPQKQKQNKTMLQSVGS